MQMTSVLLTFLLIYTFYKQTCIMCSSVHCIQYKTILNNRDGLVSQLFQGHLLDEGRVAKEAIAPRNFVNCMKFNTLHYA